MQFYTYLFNFYNKLTICVFLLQLRTKNMNKLVQKVFIFSGENFDKDGLIYI